MADFSHDGGFGVQEGIHSLLYFYFKSANGVAQEFVEAFNRVAQADISVLIVGEAGTGREIVAQALHQRSSRSADPFLMIDCQFSPRHMLQSQFEEFHLLWGGSQLAPGNGREANGQKTRAPGTIFFHEIANLDSELQARVMPFLPNGDAETATNCPADRSRPRVLASINRDPRDEVARGRLRQDLYFLLSGAKLEIPALRARKSDLADLADYFLRKYAAEFGRTEILRLTPESRELLLAYDWPGNLPEFSSVMRRIALFGNPETCLAELRQGSIAPPPPTAASREKFNNKTNLKALAKQAAQRVERDMILHVLQENQWNRKRTAAALNVSYKTLLLKIKQLGLADTG